MKMTSSNIAAAFEKIAKPRWTQELEKGNISPEGMERLKREGPQKIREIKPLGAGRDQIADLVWHPQHGQAVRKIPMYDPKAPEGREGLKAQLKETRERARDWRDVKRIKGHESLFARPLGVRGGQMFQEYVPQKEGEKGHHLNKVVKEYLGERGKALGKAEAFDKAREASLARAGGHRLFDRVMLMGKKEDIAKYNDPARRQALDARAAHLRGNIEAVDKKVMAEHGKTLAGAQNPAKLSFKDRLKVLQLRRRHPMAWDIRDMNMGQGKIYDMNFRVKPEHLMPRFRGGEPPATGDVKRHFFKERFKDRKVPMTGQARVANPTVLEHRVPNVTVKQDWLTPGRAAAIGGGGAAALAGGALLRHLLTRSKRA